MHTDSAGRTNMFALIEPISRIGGPIVQLAEHFICNEELTGSIPVGSTLENVSEE